MSNSISTLGLQLVNISNLKSGQTYLSNLTEQLTTGKKSLSLTDYSASEAQKLLNLTDKISQRNGFIAASNTIDPRLQVYDKSLTSIEDVAAQIASLTTSSGTYNPETNSSTAQQLQTFMGQISYYLNQQVGDRYIFAGTRYNTPPVSDITTLAVPPTETTPYLSNIAGNELPTYDTDYNSGAPTTSVPSAYVRDSVSIDTTQNLTYGITSTQTGFQQLVMATRFAYAATQDQSQYETYMTTARNLVSSGLSAIRAIHTDLAGNTTTLDNTKDLHQKLITDINSQLGDIQNVDINAVAVKISSFQAQLEASYAATGSMTALSILKYL